MEQLLNEALKHSAVCRSLVDPRPHYTNLCMCRKNMKPPFPVKTSDLHGRNSYRYFAAVSGFGSFETNFSQSAISELALVMSKVLSSPRSFWRTQPRSSTADSESRP